MSGGIYHYVDWMRERALEMHRVLKSTGSIYLHCDWHTSHDLKVMMDGVFGREKFRNERLLLFADPSPLQRRHGTEGAHHRKGQVCGVWDFSKEGTPVNDWWADVPKKGDTCPKYHRSTLATKNLPKC